jgi:hypothetical protein
VLIGGAIMALFGFIVAWFIKAVPLRGAAAVPAAPATPGTPAGTTVETEANVEAKVEDAVPSVS